MASPLTLALISLGFSIGMSLLFPTKTKGPKQEFSQVSGVPEGEPIPEVEGDSIVTGQVIWAGQYAGQKNPYFREDEDEDSGKGYSVTNYRYYCTAAYALCNTEDLPGGKIEGLRRVWINGKLVYDVAHNISDTSSLNLNYQETVARTLQNSRFLAQATLYTGEETQLPSSVIESFDGAGNVPAYRGLAYLVLSEFEVTRTGAFPQVEVELVASGSTSTATIFTPYTFKSMTGWEVVGTESPKWTTRAWGYSGAKAGLTYPYATYEEAVALSTFPKHTVVIAQTRKSKYQDVLLVPERFQPATQLMAITDTPNGFWDWNVPWSGMNEGHTYRTKYGTGFAFWVREPIVGYAEGFSNYIFEYDVSSSYPSHPNARGYVTVACQVRSEFVTGCLGTCSIADVSAPGLGETVLPDNPDFCVSISGVIRPNFAELSSAGSYKQLQNDEVGVDTNPDHPTGSTLLFGIYEEDDQPGKIIKLAVGPTIAVGDPNDTEAFWTAAYATAVSNGLMASGLTYGVDYPVAASNACQPPAVSEVSVGAGVLLKDVITRDCAKAGIASTSLAFDSGFDALYIDGRRTDGETPAERIGRLAELFLFDVADYDRKLNFITRGLASAVSVPYSEFGARVEGSEAVEPLQRMAPNEVELHRKVTINYFDIDASMADSKQTAQRNTVSATGERTISSPVTFDPDGAATRAHIILQAEWGELYGRYQFTLSDAWSYLAPGDWVTTTAGDRTLTFRITESEMGANGLIQFKATEDRAKNYVANLYGAATALASQRSSDIRGPTVLRLLNLPNLDDSHDKAGVYVFVAGVTTGWAGALVERSIDSGASWQEMVSVDESGGGVLGYLAQSIAINQHLTTEFTDTITVSLASYAATVSSVSNADFYNNRSMIALYADDVCELIGFRDVTDNGDGTATLSGLLRGLYGTVPLDWPLGTEVLFLYAAAVHFVEQNISAINKTYSYRATSFGASTAYSPSQSFVQTGESARERRVANIRSARDGSSNLSVTFSAIGRIYDDFDWIHSASFTGYEIDVLNNATDRTVLRTISVTTEAFDYSAADQTTDFGSAQSSILVEIYALNALTGRGVVTEATV